MFAEVDQTHFLVNMITSTLLSYLSLEITHYSLTFLLCKSNLNDSQLRCNSFSSVIVFCSLKTSLTWNRTQALIYSLNQQRIFPLWPPVWTKQNSGAEICSHNQRRTPLLCPPVWAKQSSMLKYVHRTNGEHPFCVHQFEQNRTQVLKYVHRTNVEHSSCVHQFEQNRTQALKYVHRTNIELSFCVHKFKMKQGSNTDPFPESTENIPSASNISNKCDTTRVTFCVKSYLNTPRVQYVWRIPLSPLYSLCLHLNTSHLLTESFLQNNDSSTQARCIPASVSNFTTSPTDSLWNHDPHANICNLLIHPSPHHSFEYVISSRAALP